MFTSVLCGLAAVLFSGVAAFRALRAWRRSERLLAVRFVGWTLLPIGALGTGLLTLSARLAGAITRWALHLVFNPLTWAGVVVLAVSLSILVATSPKLRTLLLGRVRRSGRTAMPVDTASASHPLGAPSPSRSGAVAGFDVDAFLAETDPAPHRR